VVLAAKMILRVLYLVDTLRYQNINMACLIKHVVSCIRYLDIVTEIW